MLEPLNTNLRAGRADRRPLVIAHRGASGFAPENTLAAFKIALALGVDGLEFDVQLSADGKPVVIHDAHVNRTTNGAGRVASFTAAELTTLDAGGWFERRLAMRPRTRMLSLRAAAAAGRDGIGFSGECVPDLDSVLKLAVEADLKRLYIELKTARGAREALLMAVLDTIRSFHAEERVTLLSFDHEVLALARLHAPWIRSAATFPISGSLASFRAVARAAEEASANEVALHYGLVSRRGVGLLHERGYAVSAWTVNRKLVMKRLVGCGVDAIMTNFPDRLCDVVHATSTGSPGSRRRRSRGTGQLR